MSSPRRPHALHGPARVLHPVRGRLEVFVVVELEHRHAHGRPRDDLVVPRRDAGRETAAGARGPGGEGAMVART